MFAFTFSELSFAGKTADEPAGKNKEPDLCLSANLVFTQSFLLKCEEPPLSDRPGNRGEPTPPHSWHHSTWPQALLLEKAVC